MHAKSDLFNIYKYTLLIIHKTYITLSISGVYFHPMAAKPTRTQSGPTLNLARPLTVMLLVEMSQSLRVVHLLVCLLQL